jgi:putative Mn2+ efflux pump MntP
MLPFAIATSIDALAIGITLSFLNVNIVSAVSIIGVVAFVLSITGVKIGNIFGNKYKKRAEITGGIILILMGLKILLEHLMFI